MNPSNAVPCGWCTTPSTRLCDAPVEGPKGLTTCDAAMCDEHRRWMGHVTRRVHGRRRCQDIDFCPEHAAINDLPLADQLADPEETTT